jgi:hypothetical protein
MGLVLDSNVGFSNDDSGIIVVEFDFKLNVDINLNLLDSKIFVSFSLDDEDLFIFPGGDSLDFDQESGVEGFGVHIDIDGELCVQVVNGEFKSGFEFNSEVVDFNSDSISETNNNGISVDSDLN